MPQIPGLGATDAVPVMVAGFNPVGTSLSSEDFFVLTRCDGKATLREVCLVSGFAEAKAQEILRRLVTAGAIRFGDGRSPAAAQPTDELDPSCDLPTEVRTAIRDKHATLSTANHFEVIGVVVDAEPRVIKRAYFRASKAFHPDRYYGKHLGRYEELLHAIFQAVVQANAVLSDAERRAAYAAKLKGGPAAAQSRQEHSAQLFEQACQTEASDQSAEALRLFDAAIRLDPQPRYLRRAAEAALRLVDVKHAEMWSRQAVDHAPQDANAHRLFGRALKMLGRAREALAEFELAAKLDPGSPHIAAERDALKRELGG